MAMKDLPQEKWGSVVTNYTQLYGKTQDYTDQLRALEKARNEKPQDPAARFLLGDHYYYLGRTRSLPRVGQGDYFGAQGSVRPHCEMPQPRSLACPRLRLRPAVPIPRVRCSQAFRRKVRRSKVPVRSNDFSRLRPASSFFRPGRPAVQIGG